MKTPVIRGFIKRRDIWVPECLCGNDMEHVRCTGFRDVDKAAEIAQSLGWKVTKKGKIYEVKCPECIVDEKNKVRETSSCHGGRVLRWHGQYEYCAYCRAPCKIKHEHFKDGKWVEDKKTVLEIKEKQ